jgi:hypothetical protein
MSIGKLKKQTHSRISRAHEKTIFFVLPFSHHTTTPQQWARALQGLSLNISHGLATHLAAALASNSHRISPAQQPAIFGTTPFFSYRTPPSNTWLTARRAHLPL